MALVLNGDGNVTGLTPGGLPDASITQADLAAGVTGNGPAFFAYKSTGSQSITTSTAVKVTYDTEVFDTNNCYASSRFTPTVAGYYNIGGQISTSGSVSLTRVILMLFKNGAEYSTLQDLVISNYRYSGSSLVYLNGSTDYVEIYTYQLGSSGLVEGGIGGVIGYNSSSYGYMVRAA